LHKSIHLSDAQATIELGRYLAANLTAGTVLLLEGDLGSGKTTLVQGIAQALGISEPIVSPTFTLICEYPEGRIPLYHLDLYRLNPEQVIDLHLESYWDGVEMDLGLMAIEWPEHLPYSPPQPVLNIKLLHTQYSRTAILSSSDLNLDI
jgi:tRNA threonylcarbamoyladenosine biosynthesis protein TsaE